MDYIVLSAYWRGRYGISAGRWMVVKDVLSYCISETIACRECNGLAEAVY